MNDTTLAGNLVTSPTTAFQELRERPRFLSVFLIVVLSTAALVYWYYQAVDMAWLKDHLFTDNPAFKNMDDDTRARAMGNMSPNAMTYGALISVLIVLPILFLLQALYFWVAGKITNVQYSFKHWFSFVAWSSLPALGATLSGVVVLLMHGSNAQMGPSELQVFSLNELWLQLKPNEAGYQLAISINLLSLWSWALTVIGVKCWSNRSWLFSSIFALLPSVLIYGGWAYFSLS